MSGAGTSLSARSALPYNARYVNTTLAAVLVFKAAHGTAGHACPSGCGWDVRRAEQPVGLQLLQRRLHHRCAERLLHVLQLHRELLERRGLRHRVPGWDVQQVGRPIGVVFTARRQQPGSVERAVIA